ncbi:MAG: c-type cytochrome domain-containing protein [Steroidobacteraceae bacterium]
MSEAKPRLLSARAYFGWVAVSTITVFAVFAALRPSLANTVKQTLGLTKPPPLAPQSFYAVRVAPILDEHCAGCHGTRRQKAKLRLDTLAAALRGGKHGPVIEPGNVSDSVLAQRIALPPRNERAMPPSSQPPLSPDDATVIRLWIGAGASGTLPVAWFKTAPRPVAHVVIPEVDVAALASARAPIAAALQSLQQRFAGAIDYESRGSARLELDASLLGHAFGDSELAAFAPLRGAIVRADLSGTAVGEASALALGDMKNLRVLRMMNVTVGPAMGAQLRELRSRGARVYVDSVDESH